METTEILKQCTVIRNVIKLPNQQLDRKDYLEIKNKLELIGGKWKGGKTQGFEFNEDPTELLEAIANGENRNLKKEYQFFATPEPLAERLVSMAQIENHHSILEPSAGQGAIVKAINRATGGEEVHCYEAMPVNQTILRKISTVKFLGEDFLKHDGKQFDRIVANPPFSKNQDIGHIKAMYNCLKSGGRLVAISSKHWQLSSNKKETEFRKWLKEVGAEIKEIKSGEFKESGTEVGGLIIIIKKAA